MRIAVIAPTEIPARRANTIQVMKMTQSFFTLGHSVKLVAPQASTSKVNEKPDWESLGQHYGLEHRFPIEWLPAHPHWRRYDFSLRAVRWAQGWDANLIYTRLPQAAGLASTVGIPTILELHDLPTGMMGPWLVRRFLRGRGAQRMVVITQALANDLAQRFTTPLTGPFILIAPDGVDLERYANLPTPEQARHDLLQSRLLPPEDHTRLSVERFTAGYTGHLYPGRGSQLLLTLAESLPEMTFLIIGGEPLDVQKFHERVTAAGVNNILLTGFVPNAHLPRYQAACDALLMPYQAKVSASSGGDIARYLSPMKLFEYMACSRVILSSDLPVLREVLNLENAVILPGNDPDAWVEALEDLQTNPDRRLKLASQAHQDVQKYTWNLRAARILEGLNI